jgi:hypothetical protein
METLWANYKMPEQDLDLLDLYRKVELLLSWILEELRTIRPSKYAIICYMFNIVDMLKAFIVKYHEPILKVVSNVTPWIYKLHQIIRNTLHLWDLPENPDHCAIVMNLPDHYANMYMNEIENEQPKI